MSLEQKILEGYKQAMKAKDSAKSGALSFLRAEIKNEAIELKKDKLDDEDCLSIIKRQVKKLKESIEQFEKGGRQDLVDKEKKNLEVLEKYLPKQLSEEELTKVIDKILADKPGATMKEMGAIMKEVMAKSDGAADGKMASEIVKQKLLK